MISANINVTLTLDNKIVGIVRNLNQKQYKQMLKDIKSCGVEYKVNLINEVPSKIYTYYQIQNIRDELIKKMCNQTNISQKKTDVYAHLNHIFYGIHDAVCRIGGNLANKFCIVASPQIQEAQDLLI